MSANHPAMLARRPTVRPGTIVRSAVRPNRAVYDTHAAPLAADSRAPRDGGRQAWHDSGNARPWRTSTGFDSIRPRI